MRNKAALFPAILLLAALPFAASAQRACQDSEARDLALDLNGIKTLVFEIGAQELVLTASKDAAVSVKAKACASQSSLLQQLSLTQHRADDKLIVRADRDANMSWNSGKRYAYLQVRASLPDTLPVQVKVGSGEAAVSGVASLSLDVGSGDAKASRVRGMVYADVGSGDIELDDIGGLNAISVGSGDLTARGVRGSATIGSVGSGDLDVSGTEGAVRLGSVGSGDARLTDIGGDITVDRVGSGDLDVERTRGRLTVRKLGSGSLNHRDVAGSVDVPRNR